ncbi:hypothetical protein TeGR_g11822, partial [Tetraparma gracilis]
FYGFRYSISGPKVHGVGMRAAIQAKADALSCFGWAQNVPGGGPGGGDAVVGEARCGKRAGAEMRDFVEKGLYPAGSQVDGAEIRVYDDTKIKLHFSHFKILDDGRVTCFRDQPHMCKAEEGAGAGEGGGGGGDEL